jgi:hypothetical protein
VPGGIFYYGIANYYMKVVGMTFLGTLVIGSAFFEILTVYRVWREVDIALKGYEIIALC